MTIIQAIHAWSKGLPAWQQDAIARLYASRELSPQDFEDLFALAKVEAGIPDEQGRNPRTLQDAEVAPPANPTRLVQVAAIKDLENVNALVQGAILPISPSGLTAIFGENGAGKSDYSRVFKHACRARDRSEPILPDARLDPKNVGRAKAVFETIVDGVLTDFVWQQQEEPPEPLTDIVIFDTHCGWAYIDNPGDSAYVRTASTFWRDWPMPVRRPRLERHERRPTTLQATQRMPHLRRNERPRPDKLKCRTNVVLASDEIVATRLCLHPVL